MFTLETSYQTCKLAFFNTLTVYWVYSFPPPTRRGAWFATQQIHSFLQEEAKPHTRIICTQREWQLSAITVFAIILAISAVYLGSLKHDMR